MRRCSDDGESLLRTSGLGLGRGFESPGFDRPGRFRINRLFRAFIRNLPLALAMTSPTNFFKEKKPIFFGP